MGDYRALSALLAFQLEVAGGAGIPSAQQLSFTTCTPPGRPLVVLLHAPLPSLTTCIGTTCRTYTPRSTDTDTTTLHNE